MGFVEFIREIVLSTRDRFKSPFIGSFITTFSIYNWKCFAILFLSKSEIEIRLGLIEQYFNEPNSYLIPLLLSIIYTLMLPYFNVWISNQTFQARSDKNEIVRKEKESKLEHDEVVAARLFRIKSAQDGVNRIDKLEAENKLLTDERDRLKGEFEDSEKSHTTEIEKIKNHSLESGKLLQEQIINLKQEYLTLTAQKDFLSVINDFSQSSFTNLKEFLWKTISDGEREMLRRMIKDGQTTLDPEDFRKNTVILLVRLGVVSPQERYSQLEFTAMARNFILESL